MKQFVLSLLTKSHKVTLTGGTFDLFDGYCDGKNGLHTHLPVSIAFLTVALGVNRLLRKQSSHSRIGSPLR